MLSALFPHRRKDRVYGLQTALLAKKLTKLLNFNHGQRALFDGWRTGKHGDLGVYVERAMKPWDGTFLSRHSVSINRVDRLLTQLAAKYRFSDAAIRSQRDWYTKTDTELKEIFMRLESWEAKWLVRLVLRDYCTVTLDENYFFQQYHFLLPDLLMFQNNFDAVFGMLRGELNSYPAVPGKSDEGSLRARASQKLTPVIGVKVGRPNFKKAWVSMVCLGKNTKSDDLSSPSKIVFRWSASTLGLPRTSMTAVSTPTLLLAYRKTRVLTSDSRILRNPRQLGERTRKHQDLLQEWQGCHCGSWCIAQVRQCLLHCLYRL